MKRVFDNGMMNMNSAKGLNWAALFVCYDIGLPLFLIEGTGKIMIIHSQVQYLVDCPISFAIMQCMLGMPHTFN